MLIAYAAKQSAAGVDYFVVAKVNLVLISHRWLPEEVWALGGDRKVAILDEVARPLAHGSRH